MESAFYIPRTLLTDNKLYNESELLKSSRHIVILAEPGAGKTRLMESLAAQLNTSAMTATRFARHSNNPQNGPLVIDAFDELAKIDKQSIYSLLESASLAKPSHLIVSSRSSEWANADSRAFVEYFSEEPLVVRLIEFSEYEQRKIFESYAPTEDFSLFQSEIARFHLTVLLSNPQFLTLFADAYLQSNRHFSDKRSIFSQALERLAKEVNPYVRPLSNPLSLEGKINLASEIFAKLLLSGSEGVTTNEALSERHYPMLQSLTHGSDTINQLLATRLFKLGDFTDTHRPVHKIVAEYSAATYLIRRINDTNDHTTLEKCLTVIAPGSAVRDELRGLLGWMACIGNRQIQHQLIALDPYAVLANGDPSQLEPSAKKLLIRKLKEIAQKDPYFRREDFGRNFSIAGFFTPEVADDIRPLLTMGEDGHLRGLVLELLVGAPIFPQLIEPIRLLMLSEQVTLRTRRLALHCLYGLGNANNLKGDLAVLIFTASNDSLNLAASIIKHFLPSNFDIKYLSGFLRVCAKLYPRDENTIRTTIGERYFVKRLVAEFDLKTTESILDTLTRELTCTCGLKFYSCKCRIGLSKVISILLDQYFELKSEPFDYKRIWSWMSELKFYGNVSAEQSKSVAVIKAKKELKQGIVHEALSDLTDSETIRTIVISKFQFHSHSGLTFNSDDYKYIIDIAFEIENIALWGAFIQYHLYRATEEYKKPNDLRKHMRNQARQRPELMHLWVQSERSASIQNSELNKIDLKSHRSNKKYKRQRQELHKENIQYVNDNRGFVESGKHWNLLKRFSDLTLFAPEKIEEEFGDKSVVKNALYNCLTVIAKDIPTLTEIARSICSSQRFHNVRILHASCLEILRKDGCLNSVQSAPLFALKTDMNGGYTGQSEEEADKLNSEINRLAFTDELEIEKYCREYIEPQLSDANCNYPDTYKFCHEDVFKNVASRLSMEWLDRFTLMPSHTRNEIFIIAVETCKPEHIKALISKKCVEVMDSPEQEKRNQDMEELQTFWCTIACYFLDGVTGTHWDWIRSDKDMVLAFNSRSGRFSINEGPSWPRLNAEKIEAIMDAYFIHWPKVDLPSSYGSYDPKEEPAYRFLIDLVQSIPSDTPENAIPVLKRMLANQVYSDLHNEIKSLLVGMERKQAHRDFEPPEPGEIVRLLDHEDIVSIEGLRAHVLQQLKAFQKEINGGEFNPARRFYGDYKNPETYLREVRAVEVIAERLQLTLGGQFIVTPEHQTKAANRIDITITKVINNQRKLLVIEAKGQWHKEVYTAAKIQLYDRYSIHPDAANQGIYLIIWVGEDVNIAEKKQHGITSAEELKTKIEGELPEELRGSIDVFVLDVSDPS